MSAWAGMEARGARAPKRVVALSRRRAVALSRRRVVAPLAPSCPSPPSRPLRLSRLSCRRARHPRRDVVPVASSCRRARRARRTVVSSRPSVAPRPATPSRRCGGVSAGAVTVALRAWARVVLPPPCVLNAKQEEMKKKRLTESCCRGLPCAPRRRRAEPRARAPMCPSCHRRAACAPGLCCLYRKPSAPKNERKKTHLMHGRQVGGVRRGGQVQASKSQSTKKQSQTGYVIQSHMQSAVASAKLHWLVRETCDNISEKLHKIIKIFV